ncbi:uncharacterized protein LOC131435028 [Malaya genurostris]|uniref:uncharacterized protein LOC131435028 n=1 Tax=Malaya genurostris TaxID=325434 RepID=UPI0026F3E986|nr:uncharacterized protein LOC131435028 [Malaya genurostris]
MDNIHVEHQETMLADTTSLPDTVTSEVSIDMECYSSDGEFDESIKECMNYNITKKIVMEQSVNTPQSDEFELIDYDALDKINLRYLRLGNFEGKPCTITSLESQLSLCNVLKTIIPAQVMLRNYFRNMKVDKENMLVFKSTVIKEKVQQRRVLQEKNEG